MVAAQRFRSHFCLKAAQDLRSQPLVVLHLLLQMTHRQTHPSAAPPHTHTPEEGGSPHLAQLAAFGQHHLLAAAEQLPSQCQQVPHAPLENILCGPFDCHSQVGLSLEKQGAGAMGNSPGQSTKWGMLMM